MGKVTGTRMAYWLQSGTRIDRQRILHLLLIGILGFLVYSNTFHVPFLFDDESSIVKNPHIRNIGNFLMNSDGYDYNPRRFLAYLTLAVNYHYGGLDVTGYHIFNLLVHVTNALLVYTLVLLTFRTPVLKESDLSSSSKSLAFFTSLLFVAHPLQTQAVTYIVQRMTSLATLFSLLSLCLYVKGSLHLEAENRSRRVVTFLFSLSWITILCAMRTKEITFTLPFLILSYEAVFFRGGVGRKKKIPYMVPVLLTLLVLPLEMINLGKPLGELLSDVSEATRVQSDLPRWEYLTTQVMVIVTYIRLLFLPLYQNLDYDYPIYRSILEPPVFMASLFLLGLLLTATMLFWRTRKGSNPSYVLIAYGILWFFLTLAVESSIIPITDVIYEHRLYLPSIGAFLAIASVCTISWRKYFPGRPARYLAFVAIAVIVILSVTTYRRNLVWRDPVTFWSDVVRKSPGKVRPYNNLGASLMDLDRYDEAITVLSTAIRVKSDHPEAYYNLGRAYLLTGRDLEAISMLISAIGIKPDYADAYTNLAAAYNRVNQFQETVRLIEAAYRLLGDKPEAHFNLAVAYVFLGKRDYAFRELGVIKPFDPYLARVLENILRESDPVKLQSP